MSAHFFCLVFSLRAVVILFESPLTMGIGSQSATGVALEKHLESLVFASCRRELGKLPALSDKE